MLGQKKFTVSTLVGEGKTSHLPVSVCILKDLIRPYSTLVVLNDDQSALKISIVNQIHVLNCLMQVLLML